MITEVEQETSDIDWFFTDGENVAFVASGGGKLPASVSKSWESNELLISFFRDLPVSTEVVINSNLDKIISPPIDERYLNCFLEMAKKGLFTFDKTVLNNFSNTYYHPVARPVNPLKIDVLPVKIKAMLLASRYHGDMNATIDSNLIS